MSDQGIALKIRDSIWPEVEGATGIPEYRVPTHNVTWSPEEWAEARDALTDYLPPVQPEDLAPNEEFCRVCNGGRWEHTRDSDTLPCMWCGFTGKQEKLPEPKPTHTQRSPYHPKVPVKE